MDLFTNGEHMIQSGASFKLPAGSLSLLKYRIFPHKVEISHGSRPFKEVKTESNGARMRNPLFSKSKVSVGGVRGKCGYDGQAYEFLLFNGTISDSVADSVVSYLSQKWQLSTNSHGMENDNAALEAPSVNSHNNYGYAYTDFNSNGKKLNHAKVLGTEGSMRVDLGNDISVFKWKPPLGVSKQAQIQWSKAKRSILEEISQFQQGGKMLGQFLKSKDQELRLTQSQIFGQITYIPAVDDDTSSNTNGENSKIDEQDEGTGVCGSIAYPGGKLNLLTAPDCATNAMQAKWNERYHAVMVKLQNFQAGGSALKKFVKSIQVELEDAWQEIFW